MIKWIDRKVYFKLIKNNPKGIANYLKKKGYRIGEECEIFPNVCFGSEPYLIEIGDRVKITDGVQFITHDGGVHVLRNINKYKLADIFGEIKIGSNVFIGNKATIMPGVSIGNNCIIGTRAVVTKNVESNSVVAGIPARVVCSLQEYLDKHKSDMDLTKEFTYEEKKKYLIKKFDIKI